MNTIKVFLSIEAYQKMRYWASMAVGEVSGLGTVTEKRTGKGKVEAYLIDDIFLLSQFSTHANTVLDDNAIGGFLTDLIQRGEDPSRVKLWWHSHGEMNAFWSNTDEQCIHNLANSSYMISLVTNKTMEILTRIDLFHPFHIKLDNIETDIFMPEPEGLQEFCAAEFQSKVIEQIDWALPRQERPDANRYKELDEKVSNGEMSVEQYEHELLMLDDIYF